MLNNYKILKTIILLLAVVKISVSSLVGKCNQCFASNNIACLDETHFATCFQGSPTSTITKCPANRFCTDDVLICHSSPEGFAPICHRDNCADCEATNGVFICLDETTYGYCFGGNTPVKGSLRSCPKGFVCNYNSREVCVPEGTYEPSCPSNTPPSTIPTTTEISTIPTESTTDDSTTLITTDSTINDQTPTTTEITTEITTTPTTQDTESTTETTTELITTPTSAKPTTVKPRDPNTICGEIGKTGYFKSDDPTCREYVYCYLLSGQYLGWVYYCDGYFNAATQKCQKARPSDCIAY